MMIIISLLILTCFNIFYTLTLVTFDIRSIIILSLIFGSYFIYFSILSQKPDRSLYGFLIVALFFPQGGNNYGLFSIEELHGAGVAGMLQGVAALAIAFNLLRTTRHSPTYTRRMKQIILALWLAVLVAFCLTIFRQFLGGFGNIPARPEKLLWVGPLIFGIIFLHGCLEFIQDYHQIDKLFYIILAAGYELALEGIFFIYLGLPQPLSSRAIHESGRLQGWVFADYTMIPLIIYCSIGFLLYKAVTKRRFICLFCIIPLVIPLINIYQRTPMVCILIVIISYLLFNFKKIIAPTVISICGIVLVIFLLSFQEINLTSGEIIKGLFTGKRQDYFDSYGDSFFSRLGAYVRGVEVFFYSFPVGVGPWMSVSEHMSSPSIPMIFTMPYGGEAYHFHKIIAMGYHTTAAHNFFINFICEYGLMGVIIICLFIWACGNNYTRWKNKLEKHNLYLYQLKALAFSILLAISFHLFFYNNTLYWLSFFILYLTFISAESEGVSITVNKGNNSLGRYGPPPLLQQKIIHSRRVQTEL